jgi:hypothetical protein
VSPNFYQVYKANSESGLISNDNIIFEDKNCKVSYNLWEEGGDVGFYIYNKTETDITLDLTKSFFVLNGVSYEYFQNRTYTKTNSSGASVSTAGYSYLYAKPTNVSGTSTASFATSYEEKPSVTIPSKTMINVSEFHVSNSRYINCDLPKYPSTKDIKTVKFDKTSSPFIFFNIVTYVVQNETVRFENKFFVSEMTNFPESKMFTSIDKSLCGNNLQVPIKAFKDVSPDKFYVKYSREVEGYNK